MSHANGVWFCADHPQLSGEWTTTSINSEGKDYIVMRCPCGELLSFNAGVASCWFCGSEFGLTPPTQAHRLPAR